MQKIPFFEDRLKYSGNLLPVIKRACEYFEIGDLLQYDKFTLGFKDYSLHLKTSGGEWVLKIFSKDTKSSEINRYINIIKLVTDSNIKHPELKKSKDDSYIYYDKKTKMYMNMVAYIPGTLLYDTKKLSPKVINNIMTEVVKINELNINPQPIFDMWQVANLNWLFNQTMHVLNPAVKAKIDSVLKIYLDIENKLPTCFIHGDITRTNVIVGKDNSIHILDFGASGIYPRLHEISIIAAHLIADGDKSLQSCVNQVVNAYIKKGGHLTTYERSSVINYTLAILAAKYLCNIYKIDETNETKEMVYWRDISIVYLMSPLNKRHVYLKGKKYITMYTTNMWKDAAAS